MFPVNLLDKQDIRDRLSELERIYIREEVKSYFFSTWFIISWITLALINTVLAQSKNRGGLAWFLVSLGLGPIATLMICLRIKHGDEKTNRTKKHRKI